MLLGVGCAIAPKYLDPSFVPATVDEIVLLSFVDIRPDKSLPFDLKDFMEGTKYMEAIRKDLERKGYTVSFSNDFGQVRSMSEDAIRAAEVPWASALGPQNAKWVMLVGLKKSSSPSDPGKPLRLNASGFSMTRPLAKRCGFTMRLVRTTWGVRFYPALEWRQTTTW
jgi:hypothetical protein